MCRVLQKLDGSETTNPKFPCWAAQTQGPDVRPDPGIAREGSGTQCHPWIGGLQRKDGRWLPDDRMLVRIPWQLLGN
jgi:hypothetical protein